MQFNRREFLNLTAVSVAAGILSPAALAGTAEPSKIKVIAFDAFPVFDPRPIFKLAGQLFPGQGADLSNAWRTRQFEYTWLRSLSRNYADFWQVTEDALVFSSKMLKLDLDVQKRTQLMQAYLELKPWPEAAGALAALKKSGFRLAFLSNFTPKMLHAAIQNSNLSGVFEHVISTDEAKIYKPAPAAYQLALDTFRVSREEILFVPFAGWDAAGAKWFGFETFWVNRLDLPVEELGVVPDAAGTSLNDLVNYLKPGEKKRNPS
jgi:2-haloacid dehalogenase